jgi:pimeloyl-ACP methyl ester carboxylesterase
MSRKMILFCALGLAVYLLLCLLLFAGQRSLLYFPQPDHAPVAQALWLQAGEVRVQVTTHAPEAVDAVLYFGGNAEDVSGSLPDLAQAFPGKAIYLMHYRGYGASQGKPSEAALVADALQLYDRVHQRHANVVVVGRSLGSGVAIHLASERPVARLVLVTPFHSILDLAKEKFPYFPMRWICRDKFESWRYAAKISAPVTIIAAANDSVIPMASTRALQASLPPQLVTFKLVADVDHNDISFSRDYVPALAGTR